MLPKVSLMSNSKKSSNPVSCFVHISQNVFVVTDLCLHSRNRLLTGLLFGCTRLRLVAVLAAFFCLVCSRGVHTLLFASQSFVYPFCFCAKFLCERFFCSGFCCHVLAGAVVTAKWRGCFDYSLQKFYASPRFSSIFISAQWTMPV